MSFDFSTIVTILVAIMVLQPLLMGRWSAVRRAQAIRAVENAHGTRVITMIHRQEKRSLFGFSVARHIDLEDAQTIIAAIKETPPDVPIDLILHTPGGLVLAAMQIARAVEAHPAKVTVYVPVYAMSGGTLIALAADEIGGYVMHRLRVAGDHPRVEIDEAAVAKVHALTGGLPRTVNLLLDRALEAGFSKSASVIDETLIDGAAVDLDLAPPSETALRAAAVIGLLAFLLLAGAAGGAYVFRSDIAALVIQWQHVPLPPRRPALAQPAPYRPPVPAEIALEGKENTP